MTSKVWSATALLCLGTLLMGGCSKKMPFFGDTFLAVLSIVQPRPSQPLADTFVAPGDRWNDEQDIPWAVARSLGQMCKLSYAGPTEIDAALSRWNFSKIDHFHNGSLYACVASDDHTVLVAFRGTDDSKDWLVNIDAVPQLVPHGIIHSGFYQGMKTLYPEIAAAATAQGVEKKNLWITGHSLGGALAVAFAYECLAQGRFKPAGVVTFGQPLLADSALGAYISDQLGGNYVRFVNGRDVVTRVPPGYVHFGKLVWFHEGKLDMGDQSGAAELAPLSAADFESLKKSLRDLRQLGRDFDPARLQSYEEKVAAVTDHLMDAYLHGIDTVGKPPHLAATARDPSSLEPVGQPGFLPKTSP